MRPSRWFLCTAVATCAPLLMCSCDGWLETSGPTQDPRDNDRSRPHPAPANAENHAENDSDGSSPDLAPGDDESLTCDGIQPPGETPLLRLTETEYNNTVRDLFPELELPTFEIPGDELLGPFEMNISSPVGEVVAERYQKASETISEKAAANFQTVTDCDGAGGTTTIVEREAEQVGADVGQSQGEFWNVWSNGSLTTEVDVPARETYTVRIVAAGTKADGKGPDMELLVDGAAVDSVDVDAPRDAPEIYEAETDIGSGRHTIGARFTNDKNTETEDRNLLVDRLALLRTGISGDALDGCIETFIEDFGHRAWREPLDSTTKDRLTSLFDDANDSYGPEFGLRVVLEAILQSPRFLYRFDDGQPGEAEDGAVPLTDFEVASRLSYFLWDSAPDAELLEAARDGELSTEEGIERQARRMLRDPRAREALNRAILAVFGLRDFESTDKKSGDVDEAMREAMKRETLAFIDHILWERDAQLQTLLTADYAYVSEATAPLYDIDVPAGDGLRRVEFADDAPRSGILTQPAVLARHGWGEQSVHRGKFLSKTLMCNRPPDPPNELNNPPEREEGESDRSQAVDRMEHSQCGICHQRMEPMGLVYDPFDSRGKYQSTDEHGNELHSQGELVGTDNFDGEVEGPKELADKIARSERVEHCFTQQWLKRAFARTPTRKEACAMKTVTEALDASDGDLGEMFVAITTTEAFRYKPAETD